MPAHPSNEAQSAPVASLVKAAPLEDEPGADWAYSLNIDAQHGVKRCLGRRDRGRQRPAADAAACAMNGAAQ